jgi:hypothetical protein
MKTPGIYIGALAVFCIAALVIGSAGASAMMQKGTGSPSGNNCGKGPEQGGAHDERMSHLLSNLTEKGYDVSSISAAVTSGDYRAAMNLLKEFRTAHPDAFPAFGEGNGKCPMKGVANETRMLEMLDNLTAKGYDVSAIRTSVEGGDLKTAMTQIREFMTANPDARPARGDGNIAGHMGGQRREKNTWYPDRTV